MAKHRFRAMAQAGLIMGVALLWPLEATARGGGVGASAGTGGHARGILAAGGYGNGASLRFGAGSGFQNRAGLNRAGLGRAGLYRAGLGRGIGRAGAGRGGIGRSYFPTGGFGAPGYYPAGPSAPYAASYGLANAAPDSITTRSVIIRRGPAFGEPGYVSHPAIYRLTEARSRRPGTRRFRVERIDF